MTRLACAIAGHSWRWVLIREGWGCVEAMACRRCEYVPSRPFGDAEGC